MKTNLVRYFVEKKCNRKKNVIEIILFEKLVLNEIRLRWGLVECVHFRFPKLLFFWRFGRKITLN